MGVKHILMRQDSLARIDKMFASISSACRDPRIHNPYYGKWSKEMTEPLPRIKSVCTPEQPLVSHCVATISEAIALRSSLANGWWQPGHPETVNRIKRDLDRLIADQEAALVALMENA